MEEVLLGDAVDVGAFDPVGEEDCCFGDDDDGVRTGTRAGKR